MGNTDTLIDWFEDHYFNKSSFEEDLRNFIDDELPNQVEKKESEDNIINNSVSSLIDGAIKFAESSGKERYKHSWDNVKENWESIIKGKKSKDIQRDISQKIKIEIVLEEKRLIKEKGINITREEIKELGWSKRWKMSRLADAIGVSNDEARDVLIREGLIENLKE